MVSLYDEDFSAVFLFLGYPQFLAPVLQYLLQDGDLISVLIVSVIIYCMVS